MKRSFNEIDEITEDDILNTKSEEEYYSLMYGYDYKKNKE